MKKYIILVQASSTSWSGGPDPCLNILDGKTVLQNTIDKIFKDLLGSILKIIIIAPYFDKGGLDSLNEQHPLLSVSYGFDESPLMRMVHATHELTDEDTILRLNGLNFCFDSQAALKNLELADSGKYDCVKFPDDFPALFSSDIYKLGTLREMSALENLDAKFHIHPKYYMELSEKYVVKTCTPNTNLYDNDFLSSIRAKCVLSMSEKRIEIVEANVVKSACTITYHYQLALAYLNKDMKILDCACGSGFGSQMVAGKVKEVIGLDIDKDMIHEAETTNHHQNSRFIEGSALTMPFKDEFFDCVMAFEIIEHVDPDSLLIEIHRVLRTDGILILSTPQNSLGHIPLTPDHSLEFSREKLESIVSRCFSIVEFIGIKQGTISMNEDRSGSNSFVVAKKVMN